MDQRNASSSGPIFILGLQRGGTNQLLNILRSHPETIWPDGELHEVLRPKWEGLRAPGSFLRQALWYLPFLIRQGDVLSPRRPHRGPQNGMPQALRHRIARRLDVECARNAREVARFRRAMAREGYEPTRLPADGDAPRMVVKLVNYNVGLAQDLLRIYPDARFVGIIREAEGICESMISRGMSPDVVLPMYQYVARELLTLRAAGFPVLLLRFEDIIANITASTQAVYDWCDLDAAAVSGLCLQDKTRVTDDKGNVVGMRKVDAFYDLDSAAKHLRCDVNSAAKARLPRALQQEIAARCGPLMQQLGYATDAPTQTGGLPSGAQPA